jgi:chaperonin GroES
MDTKIKLKVIGHNILIKKINQQKFGSLLLPENSSDNFLRGIICGLGTGSKDTKGEVIPFLVQLEDEVLFPKYKGHDVRIDDLTYVVLAENEIIAIVKK